MCPPSNRASRQAEANEQARQRAVRDAMLGIDRAFDGRDAALQRFVEALRGEYRDRAQRQRHDVDRNLRFALARSGLTGGSAAVDAQARVGDEYRRGLLEAENRAQGALASLRQADAQARADTMRLAQGGAQASAAAQAAAAQLRANLSSARARAQVDGLGEIFAGTRALYRRQREDERYRAGLARARTYANPFSRES